jgi:hypothetical protein
VKTQLFQPSSSQEVKQSIIIIIMNTNTSGADIFAYVLYALAAYNLIKLPWFCGIIPVPSYGLEISMPLHYFGFRSYRLQSHPFFFVFFHIIMGASILIMYGLRLQGCEWDHMDVIYFTVAVVFAIHVIPERSGVPNRVFFGGLNESCMVQIFAAATLQYFGIWAGTIDWSIVLAPCLVAIVMELLPDGFIFLYHKIVSGGTYRMEGTEGTEEPLPPNMKGYSGLCPCASYFDPRPIRYETIKDM